ncbi:hypothetical protein QR680_017643 [Steinernema hermaphroditum]|uniref:Uncharacterized protein n=1 Tax=Steinernema hermaphroditum TaxID=289476 RepID=A0AA39HFB7_9BILA|nr:hypothetical protein QR680_017643 [Steinernema hermaphroditum]
MPIISKTKSLLEGLDESSFAGLRCQRVQQLLDLAPLWSAETVVDLDIGAFLRSDSEDVSSRLAMQCVEKINSQLQKIASRVEKLTPEDVSFLVAMYNSHTFALFRYRLTHLEGAREGLTKFIEKKNDAPWEEDLALLLSNFNAMAMETMEWKAKYEEIREELQVRTEEAECRMRETEDDLRRVLEDLRKIEGETKALLPFFEAKVRREEAEKKKAMEAMDALRGEKEDLLKAFEAERVRWEGLAQKREEDAGRKTYASMRTQTEAIIEELEKTKQTNQSLVTENEDLRQKTETLASKVTETVEKIYEEVRNRGVEDQKGIGASEEEIERLKAEHEGSLRERMQLSKKLKEKEAAVALRDEHTEKLYEERDQLKAEIFELQEQLATQQEHLQDIRSVNKRLIEAEKAKEELLVQKQKNSEEPRVKARFSTEQSDLLSVLSAVTAVLVATVLVSLL